MVNGRRWRDLCGNIDAFIREAGRAGLVNDTNVAYIERRVSQRTAENTKQRTVVGVGVECPILIDWTRGRCPALTLPRAVENLWAWRQCDGNNIHKKRSVSHSARHAVIHSTVELERSCRKSLSHPARPRTADTMTRTILV